MNRESSELLACDAEPVEFWAVRDTTGLMGDEVHLIAFAEEFREGILSGGSSVLIVLLSVGR